MSTNVSLRAEMAHIAASAGSVGQRADALLRCLHQEIPYAAAWIGVRDPETRMHRRVGSDGYIEPLVRYFAMPEADDEVEALGLNRFQPPVPASSLGVPLAEIRAWGDYLLPAGFKDGVAMALFTADGRHLGFLSLLTGDPVHPTASYSGLLADLRPIIAEGLDRLPSFGAAAQLTDDALGGVVTTRTGRRVPVPGLPVHPLLTRGSAALAVARRYAAVRGTAAAFLCPWAETLVRISVLDCRDDTADHLDALVLVRPGGDALQFERSDLRLLGALVDGWDDDRIRAGTGIRHPSRNVARLARELGFPTTGALVQHAAREGLHLPPALWPQARAR